MIKVFEAFAGYGSQRMALRNLGIAHEVVGISEIDGDAILSYVSIHTDFLKKRVNIGNFVDGDDEELYEYLEEINVPLCYKTFANQSRKLKRNKLKEMYLANKLAKNYGDIRGISAKNLPDFDFFTYSFPCQDISVAGYQEGLDSESGTRSSLLWECCKIIEEKRPKYLMMENVKNLVGKNHKENFEKFLEYLESLGYKNKWAVLNARDYGIPQNRERVFCISTLDGSEEFEFPKPIELTRRLNDMLLKNVDDRFYLKTNQITHSFIDQEVSYCLDANYSKGTTLEQFLTKRRRQLVSGRMFDDDAYYVRRLTPLETWRLMGCSDNDFQKAETAVSNTSLYKQAGNSIVVPVLESIFTKLFIEKK